MKVQTMHCFILLLLGLSHNKDVIYNLIIYHFTGVVLAACWEIHSTAIQKLHFKMSFPENVEKKMWDTKCRFRFIYRSV